MFVNVCVEFFILAVLMNCSQLVGWCFNTMWTICCGQHNGAIYFDGFKCLSCSFFCFLHEVMWTCQKSTTTFSRPIKSAPNICYENLIFVDETFANNMKNYWFLTVSIMKDSGIFEKFLNTFECSKSSLGIIVMCEQVLAYPWFLNDDVCAQTELCCVRHWCP